MKTTRAAAKKKLESIMEEEKEEEEDVRDSATLKQVYKEYKELLYIEDTDRLDIVFATYLSSKKEGVPLWLILVGASGDMKTLQVSILPDKNVFALHNLTSKTLVNGYKDKEKYPDLAPLLDNKIIVISDMAQILKLPAIEKAEVWAQLRDLYDGYAGKTSGQGVVANYKDIKTTLIGCSTPTIDAQLLIHQDLGTRELIFRTEGNKEKKKVMDKCLKNEGYEKEIARKLKKITEDFLIPLEIVEKPLSQEIEEKIKEIALYTSYMRSTAEFDSYTNELRNYVYPEEPTRIIKQLKRVYVCLKSLDKDYPDEKAIRILWKLGRGSAFPVRIKLFEFLKKNPDTEYSTSQLSEIMSIGKATAKREASVLENVKLIVCNRQETNFPDRFYEYWKLNPNPSTDIGGGMVEEQLYKNKGHNKGIISVDGLKGKNPEYSTEKKNIEVKKI